MRQPIDLISRLNTFKATLKFYPLITLTFLCLSCEQVYGDSTYFPDDMDVTDEVTESTAEENSAAIKEWAEIHPPKKQTAEVIPAKNKKETEVRVAESQASTPQKSERPQPKPVPAVAAKPMNTSTSDSKTTLVSEEQKPSNAPPSLAAPTPPIAVAPASAPVAAAPTPPAPLSATKTSSAKEPQALQLTAVEPRAKALPVKDQAVGQNVSQKTVLSYSDAANNRSPLGILEPTQEVHNQKWYIYSSAVRGLKSPSDKLQVVSMEGSPPNRGEEIRELLVEMGIEPEKIQLIHGTGEEHQNGMIYIFAGK